MQTMEGLRKARYFLAGCAHVYCEALLLFSRHKVAQKLWKLLTVALWTLRNNHSIVLEICEISSTNVFFLLVELLKMLYTATRWR